MLTAPILHQKSALMFNDSAAMDLLSLRNAQETVFLRLLKIGMVFALEFSALLILINEQ